MIFSFINHILEVLKRNFVSSQSLHVLSSKTIHIFLLLFFLYSCGRAGDVELDAKDGKLGIVAVKTQGDTQTAFTGEVFDNDLYVQANVGGFGLPGMSVEWAELTDSGLTMQVLNNPTDNAGLSRLRLTAIKMPYEDVKIRARISGLDGEYADAIYTLQIVPGGHIMYQIQGDNQSIEVNTKVPVNPTIRITDEFGNLTPNWPVTWTVITNNGANLQFTIEYEPTGNDIAVSWVAFTDDDLTDHQLYTYTNSLCSKGGRQAY